MEHKLLLSLILLLFFFGNPRDQTQHTTPSDLSEQTREIQIILDTDQAPRMKKRPMGQSTKNSTDNNMFILRPNILLTKWIIKMKNGENDEG